MSNELITDDQTVNLKDCRLPLQSFGVYGLFGLKNSGKTFQSFNMLDAYLEHAEKHKKDYDIMNFRNLNGLFTNIYYISPSENTDRTLQKVQEKYKNCKGLSNYSNGINIITLTKENINFTIDYIKQECENLNDFCNDQIQIISLLQNKKFVDEVRNLKYRIKFSGRLNTSKEDLLLYSYLSNFCQQLENYKIQYPQDKYNEVPKNILNNLNELEQILEINYKINDYQPYFMRYPKNALILDDASGSSVICNTIENPLFKFLNQTRHFSLFYTAINIHSLSVVYNSFKICMTGFLLFSGLNLEKVEQLFEVIGKLDSKYFSKKEFVSLYKEVEGYDMTYEERIKQKIQYDFLYVIISPYVQIYYNFDDKLL